MNGHVPAGAIPEPLVGRRFGGHDLRAVRHPHGLAKAPGPGLELFDRERGHRPQVVGPEHVEQALRQLGKVVVQRLPDLGREEGEALEEALDVGVLAGLDEMGSLVVRGAELAGEVADVVEFLVVVGRTHGYSFTLIRPELSTRVSKWTRDRRPPASSSAVMS